MSVEATKFGEIRTPSLMGSTGLCLVDPGAAEFARIVDGRAFMIDQTELASSEDFWPRPGSYMERYRPYTVRNGILVIPVHGLLLNDFNLNIHGWAVGYDYIREAAKRAKNDPDVRGVVFDYHSPGGHASGCEKTARAIKDLVETKTVIASVNEQAGSGAMWLASQAGRILIESSGIVGSVGVIVWHEDHSKLHERMGVKMTAVYKGERKKDGTSNEPLTPEAMVKMQKRIDFLHGKFCAAVASGRGMTAEAVKATEAGTYIGEEGVAVGFADEIGSLEDAIRLAAGDGAAAKSSTGETKMTTNTPEAQLSEQNKTPAPAAANPAQVTPAPSAADQTPNDAKSVERERISAIMDSEAGKANPAQARVIAFQTDMPADQAVMILSAGAPVAPENVPAPSTQEESAKTEVAMQGQAEAFKSMMRGQQNPNISSLPENDGQKDRVTAAMELYESVYGKSAFN